MENGFVILSIVALLFLSIYGYTYGSVALAKIKQKKAEKKELMNEEMRLEERKRKQAMRDEKLRKQNKRREEIKHELKLLEEMKRNNERLNTMRVETMKEKKVS
ncbi:MULTISPECIES: hypothetical protein [Hwangdonia]|uniref:Uncharacterized protein n=1 Tax=Hwangdonia seohaensis TaxID=1240727 RepID=A0ABW3RG47_9FLAO|nr:hypothetical protein [Hwangdonia seohaensis]